MPRTRPPIGAHVSIAGGLARTTLKRADEVGAEVIQVFVANPRGWAEPAPDPVGDEAFRDACRLRAVPVFVHAPYLINFGSPSSETRIKSADALSFSLRRGAAIGASGVVVHAGSAVLGNSWTDAMKQVRESVRPLLDGLDRLEDGPRLLIEPTAGGGGALASDVDSIGAYLDALDDPRVGLCIDTCHLYAAGHDLSNTRLGRRAIADLVREVGRDRIALVHVNDSRDPVGSRRDRHASIGQGSIGLAGLESVLGAPALRGVPLVVETQDSGQANDIELLKALRS